jgi:hypothetical protein
METWIFSVALVLSPEVEYFFHQLWKLQIFCYQASNCGGA